MTRPRSARTYCAGSTAAESSSGTTRTVNMRPIWTDLTCRASRRSASPTTSSPSRTGCCTTSRRASSSSTALVRCRTGIGDWLLDLELAYGVFTADRTALVAQDLGLAGKGIDEVVQAHEKFFNATKRVQSLKALLSPDDDATKLQAKISAVVLGQREHSLLEITRTLLTENAKGHTPSTTPSSTSASMTSTGGVSPGSTATSPRRRASMTWCCGPSSRPSRASSPTGRVACRTSSLTSPACVTTGVARRPWPRSPNGQPATLITSRRSRTPASVTWWPSTYSRRPTRRSSATWHEAVAEQTVTPREVTEVVRARQSSVWIDNYNQLYTAVASASELLGELASLNLGMQSFDDGLERYRREWFRIDQLYRQFVYAARTAEYPKPLEAVARAGREALHQQVRLRAGECLAAAGRPGREVALDRTALADGLLLPLRRAAGARWRQEGRGHHLRRPALRGGRRAWLAHPAGGPLRRQSGGRSRRPAELHPARHGGASAALEPQALGRRQDRACRQPADQ